MMDQAIDIALSEREVVVVHMLFAHRAIDQMLGLSLDEIQHDGSRAEADVLVADQCRSPSPAAPAAVRTAREARVTAITDGNGSVAPLDGKAIVHQKVGSVGVANLMESFGSQRLLDGCLHALANRFAVGVGIAPNGVTAGNHVA